MKKLLPITIALSLIQTLTAQTYEPIRAPGQEVEFNVCHPIFDGTSEETYRNLGETIINNLEYTIIGDNFFQGFLRQDSTNSKAWFKEDNSDEKLIMDLNMEIGDSIFIDCEMYGQRYSKAVHIDTVDSRKVIELDYIYPRILATQTDTIIYRPLKFIEGIGTNGFLMYQIDDIEFHLYGFLLETVFKDDNMEYENLEDCAFPLSNENIEPLAIEIYPNPASDYIEILNNGNEEISSVSIFDVSGSMVLSKSKIYQKEQIDIQFLNQGIYVMQIDIANQSIIKRVVVK